MSHTKTFASQTIGQVMCARDHFDLRKLSGGAYQFVFHNQADRDNFRRSIKDLDGELFITEGLMTHTIGNTITLNLPDDMLLWLSCNESVRNFLGPKAKSTKIEAIKLLFSWSEKKFFPLP